MSSVTRFVGLDYHQESIQVCVLNSGGEVLVNRKVDNCVGDVIAGHWGGPERFSFRAAQPYEAAVSLFMLQHLWMPRRRRFLSP